MDTKVSNRILFDLSQARRSISTNVLELEK